MANIDVSMIPAKITITNTQAPLTAEETEALKNINAVIANGDRSEAVAIFNTNMQVVLEPGQQLILRADHSNEAIFYFLMGEKSKNLKVEIAEIA